MRRLFMIKCGIIQQMPVMTNDPLINELINDSKYQIFPDGTILTTVTGAKGSKKGEWRKCCFREQTGYKYLFYKFKQLALHRILYAKFIGPLDQNKVVNHKDYNRLNNSLDNLELVTESENTTHAYKKHSVVAKTTCKLNYQKAEQIRKEFKEGMTRTGLAIKYGVSKGSIVSVLSYKTWTRHLEVAKKLHEKTHCNQPSSQPPWVDLQALSNFYKNKPKGHAVDHIIPLKNPDVCGLHVPWNLQYLPKKENEVKGNSFDFTYDNESWKKLLKK